MDEYIKRKDALEITKRTSGDYATAFAEIRKIPTADVVSVVHCKDCKYQDDCWNCYHPRHHGILLATYPLDFCSYGERKDGGADND